MTRTPESAANAEKTASSSLKTLGIEGVEYLGAVQGHSSYLIFNHAQQRLVVHGLSRGHVAPHSQTIQSNL